MSLQDPLKDLNHLQRYLVEEYVEDYQEGALSRRQALKYIAAAMGSLTLANTVLAGCAPVVAPVSQPGESPAAPGTAEEVAASATPEEVAATATLAVLETSATTPTPELRAAPKAVNVSPDDPAIEAGAIALPGDGLELVGYQAKPVGEGPFPAVVVAHENRGLTPYIQDVVRRLAKAGYVALAVDQLSAQGGTEKVSDPSQIPAVLGGTPPDVLAGYYLSGIEHLKGLPSVDPERLGMMGFCFGGGMTWLVATKSADLKAAVPFYGPNPPLDALPGIQAAVLAIYGENDSRINAGIPSIEAAMQEQGKVFEKIIYPGASHAFHNDTGRNHNPEAAQDAWAQTLAWFEEYLG